VGLWAVLKTLCNSPLLPAHLAAAPAGPAPCSWSPRRAARPRATPSCAASSACWRRPRASTRSARRSRCGFTLAADSRTQVAPASARPHAAARPTPLTAAPRLPPHCPSGQQAAAVGARRAAGLPGGRHAAGLPAGRCQLAGLQLGQRRQHHPGGEGAGARLGGVAGVARGPRPCQCRRWRLQAQQHPWHPCATPARPPMPLPRCRQADEMGLGKTIQCVSLLGVLSETVGHRGPFLVVVPLSVVPNWLREFRRWTPEVRGVGLGGGAPGRVGCAAACPEAVLRPHPYPAPTPTPHLAPPGQRGGVRRRLALARGHPHL
jgi:hypothetical protein